MKFSMLLANNNRSKAYLQNLLRNNFIPEHVILLDDNKNILPEQKNVYGSNSFSIKYCPGDDSVFFDINQTLNKTLEEHQISFERYSLVNPNEETIVNAVAGIASKNIIYSGPGGIILKENILSQGKRFIHIHPGKIPDYRGSTTFYYSFLIERIIYCSVIILDKEIDYGSLLYEKTFSSLRRDQDIDTVTDPLFRAATLLEFMQKNKDIVEKPRTGKDTGNIFYIIHPVIKHLSILKMRDESVD